MNAVVPFVTAAPLASHQQHGLPSFTVPPESMSEFVALTEREREEIITTLHMLSRAHAIRLQGQRNWVAATNALGLQYADRRGMSGETLRRKYDAYLASKQDWRVLVKGYKTPERQPKAFIEYIQALCERNPRSMSAALKTFLYEIWPSGVSVPGYGTWQEWYAREFPCHPVPSRCPSRFPSGWGADGRNLRRYLSSHLQRALFSTGYKAAHADMLSLTRDTSKLQAMQLITIDDFQLDHLCVFPGDRARGLAPQIAYIGGLVAIDVATRKRLAWCIGPMVEREVISADGTSKKVRSTLTKHDVQGLLYLVFSQHGIPTDHECVILCENATATIGTDFAHMLGLLSGGKIRVERTSMLHNKTLVNGFAEGGGTPWQKGWIESSIGHNHNLLASVMAGAKSGYKGSNERLNAPGGLAASVKYSLRLLGVEGAKKLDLPPAVLEEIDLPFEGPAAFGAGMVRCIEIIENYPHHKMGGFGDVTEFYWSRPELPAPAGIDPVGANDFHALGHMQDQDRLLMIPKVRKETIAERWQTLSLKSPRTMLSAEVLQFFFTTPKRAVYRNRSVSFTHEKRGYTYIAPADKPELLSGLLEKSEVLVYVDFQRPGTVVVADAAGRALGVLTMLGGTPQGVDITDREAIEEARQERAAWLNSTMQTLRERPMHRVVDEQLAAMRANNERLTAPYEAESKLARVSPTAPATDIAPDATRLGREVTRRQAAAAQANDRAKTLVEADDLDATRL